MSGAQCVMMPGAVWMLEWPAGSWDFLVQVCIMSNIEHSVCVCEVSNLVKDPKFRATGKSGFCIIMESLDFRARPGLNPGCSSGCSQ